MAHALKRVPYAAADADRRQFAFVAREPAGHERRRACGDVGAKIDARGAREFAHVFGTRSTQQTEEIQSVVQSAFGAAYRAKRRPQSSNCDAELLRAHAGIHEIESEVARHDEQTAVTHGGGGDSACSDTSREFDSAFSSSPEYGGEQQAYAGVDDATPTATTTHGGSEQSAAVAANANAGPPLVSNRAARSPVARLAAQYHQQQQQEQAQCGGGSSANVRASAPPELLYSALPAAEHLVTPKRPVAPSAVRRAATVVDVPAAAAGVTERCMDDCRRFDGRAVQNNGGFVAPRTPVGLREQHVMRAPTALPPKPHNGRHQSADGAAARATVQADPVSCSPLKRPGSRHQLAPSTPSKSAGLFRRLFGAGGGGGSGTPNSKSAAPNTSYSVADLSGEQHYNGGGTPARGNNRPPLPQSHSVLLRPLGKSRRPVSAIFTSAFRLGSPSRASSSGRPPPPTTGAHGDAMGNLAGRECANESVGNFSALFGRGSADKSKVSVRSARPPARSLLSMRGRSVDTGGRTAGRQQQQQQQQQAHAAPAGRTERGAKPPSNYHQPYTAGGVLAMGECEQAPLAHVPWFCGPLDRDTVARVLAPCEPGAFVVRQSASAPGAGLALSVRVPDKCTAQCNVAHYLIVRTPDGYCVKGFSKVFPSIQSLVTHHSVLPEQLPCRLKFTNWHPLVWKQPPPPPPQRQESFDRANAAAGVPTAGNMAGGFVPDVYGTMARI